MLYLTAAAKRVDMLMHTKTIETNDERITSIELSILAVEYVCGIW